MPTPPKGKLGDGQQLIISWDYDFVPNASRDEIYTYDDKQGLVRLTQNKPHGFLSAYSSPDNKFMAVCYQYAWNSQVSITSDPRNLEPILSIRHAASFKWSHNSRYCAWWASDMDFNQVAPEMWTMQPYIFDVQTGAYIKSGNWTIADYVWLPNDELLAVIHPNKRGPHILKLNTAGQVIDDSGDLDFLKNAYHKSLSSDGTRIAYTISDPETEYGTLVCIAGLDAANIQIVGKPKLESFLEWSRDGQHLAFLNENKQLVIVSIDGTYYELLVLNESDPSGENNPDLAWSPDSQQLVVTSFIESEGDESDTNFGSALFAMNFDGSNLRQIHEPHGLIFDVKWRTIPA